MAADPLPPVGFLGGSSVAAVFSLFAAFSLDLLCLLSDSVVSFLEEPGREGGREGEREGGREGEREGGKKEKERKEKGREREREGRW